ncbi:Gfo/Idh/MocA family protein [Desulfofalx alkaliphila]|uniref:Gfo/Idh/MocA family protein n=1 Tax=Desulfofalx alkaliphila TaxID=105483 RepID=UPI0004E204D1|nr:Gfo/Idh/MocA family oxidoreductase [Desulfofalx alkaliphila]
MIGIALIGCGAWGSAYLRTLTKIKGANLLYVCDKNLATLEAVAQRHPRVITTDNYKLILRDPKVQAVIVATPAVTHYSIAADCLANDKAVLVEKPITDNVKDAKDLVRLSVAKDQILMIGHLMEYHPAVERLKEYVRAGAFGSLKYIHCERTNCNVSRQDINVISDLAVHDFTVLLYLLDSRPRWVSARGRKWLDGSPLATVLIDMGFPNDLLVHLHTNWHYPLKTRKISIIGDKMMALFDDTRRENEKLTILREGKKELENIILPRETPLYRQCTHFVDCVIEHRQPRTCGSDAIRVMELIEAIEQAIETNSTVYL